MRWRDPTCAYWTRRPQDTGITSFFVGAFSPECPSYLERWDESTAVSGRGRHDGKPRDDESPEIVELCIIDREGAPLLNTLIQPNGRMHPDAAAKSGITDELLAGAPRFSEVAGQIVKHLQGTAVVIYNARYDDPLLTEAIEACGHVTLEYQVRCAMRAYAAFRGEGRKGYRLEAACAHEGITQTHAHRALGDCLATLTLLHRMAERAELVPQRR